LVRELCKKAKKQFRMKVRVGGGIRTVRRAQKIAAWGVQQIIIGSAAFGNGKINARFLKRLTSKVPRRRIIIALDTSRGRITTHGWRKKLLLRAEDVMPKLEPYCAGFLCTDVDREGTMKGGNLERFRQLRCASSYPIIAAGGIATHREIAALEKMGMDAAVGMAVYKNRLR